MAQQQGKLWRFTIYAAQSAGQSVGPQIEYLRRKKEELEATSGSFRHDEGPLEGQITQFGECGGCQMELCPTTGKPHLQGWCLFAGNMRIPKAGKVSGVKAIHYQAWWGKSDSLKGCQTYCSKEDSRLDPYVEWGEVPVRQQGKRNDLKDAAAAILAAEGTIDERMKAVAMLYPEVVLKYPSGLKALVEASQPQYQHPKPDGWRPWQTALEVQLLSPPDNRHIYWVHDKEGGKGKSTMVRYFVSNPECKAVMLSGKVADMAYIFKKRTTRIVFFDLSRTKAEEMNHLYEFAECLKNGVIVSGKYEGSMLSFPIPHVVFMANFMPDYGKWSKDRVILVDLDNEVDEAPPAEGPAGAAGGAGMPMEANPFDVIDLTQVINAAMGSQGCPIELD